MSLFTKKRISRCGPILILSPYSAVQDNCSLVYVSNNAGDACSVRAVEHFGHPRLAHSLQMYVGRLLST